jgi:Protein of unknown function (DUF1579)
VKKLKIGFVLTLALLALAPALALAQGNTQGDKKPAPPPGMSAADMEAMMKAATPGENHKMLQRYVGDWTYSVKTFATPGQPAMESTGTMHAEPILGGRYIQSVYKGSFAGQPFEGRSTDGYDNVTKQYVGAWVDNMGTGILNSSGTCDAGCKVVSMSADMMDPTSGKKIATKSVTTWSDDNHFKMEMFMINPASGKSIETMEISANRK